MKPVHTPAPWTFKPLVNCLSIVKGNDVLAYAERVDQSAGPDLMLMAAAPDLLALLIEARRTLSGHLPPQTLRHDPRLDLIQRIDAAIVKAGGAS